MRAYLFDLDGTLLDTEKVWCDAVSDYLRSRECPMPENETIRLVYGRSWTDIYNNVTQRFEKLRDTGIYEMQNDLADFFHKARAKTDIRIPGSVELLKSLSKNTPCCIVSGSPRKHIAEAIAIMDCAKNLQFYVGAEDYAFGKPAPDCYLLAAEKLGVQPADCVVFEDSAAGVSAGKSAGMRVVALSRPCRPKQNVSAADLILEDLSQFEE